MRLIRFLKYLIQAYGCLLAFVLALISLAVPLLIVLFFLWMFTGMVFGD